MSVIVLYWGVSATTAKQYWLRLGTNEYRITIKLARQMVNDGVPTAPAVDF